MGLQLDLNLLPVLEALAAEASVSGAAQRLGITQSAVSHALRRLRVHFKDPLFVRSGNSMLPTPRLLAMEPVIRNTMEALRDHLNPPAEFDASTSTRTFTISSTDLGEVVLVPLIVTELRRRAPGCRLRVVSLRPPEIRLALEKGAVDLAIGSFRDNLYQQELLMERFVCIASKRWHPDLSVFEDAARFSALPHVAISPFGDDGDVYEWIFDGTGIRRRFALTTRSFLSVPSLVEQSDLVATVPEFLPRHLPKALGLQCIAPPLQLPRGPIRQVWHPRFDADPANVWLRQLILSLSETIRTDRP